MSHGSASIAANLDWTAEQPYAARGQFPGQLPPEARDFLDTMRLDAEEANDAANTASSNAYRERQDRVHDQNALDAMQRDPQTRRNDRSFVEVQRRLEASGERVRKLQDRAAALGARWAAYGSLLNRIDQWLADRAGDMLESFAGPAPKLSRGEKPADALNRLRARLGELRQEAARVERAPLPAKAAKAAARAFVEMMAFGGRPDVGPLFRGEAKPEWPNLATSYQQPLIASDGTPLSAGGVISDALGLTAWLHGPAMLKALEAQIDAEAKDDRAMTAEARTARLAALAVETLAVEREEEALVRALADDGVAVERRPDASPEAVLQVRIAA